MSTPAPAIAEAVEAVRVHFTEHPVSVVPDGTGGVFVIIDQVSLGASYMPSITWLGFQISAAYPDADVYPHYIGPVARVDGRTHGPAVQAVTWQERPALQLSRRSNNRDTTVDNAAFKAERICRWFADQ